MAVRVVCGSPCDARAEQLLDETLRAGPESGRLHVVRTRTRAADLRETILERRGLSYGFDVLTLEDLVGRLARARRTPRQILGDAERVLLIDRIAREDARPPLAGISGLPRWLSGFFSQLRQADVFTSTRARERFPSLARPDDPVRAEALR